MKTDRLPLLAVITLVVVVIAFFAARQDAPQTSKEKMLLFAGLNNKINTVSEILMTSADSSISLVKQGEQWQLKEADHYPADFSKIKQIGIALTELKVLAEKTGKKELFNKLGVEEPADEDAKSTLLVLNDDKQKQLLSLIVGNTRRSSPQAKPAFYARLPDSGPALLVEGKLDISMDKNSWFERDLLSINAKRIRSVLISHEEENTVQVQRDEQDGQFTLAGIAEGRTADAAAVGRLADLLEGIYIDDVRAEANFSFPSNAVVTAVETFDGLIANITAAEIDGANYIKLRFDYKDIEPATKESNDAASNENKPLEKASVEQEVEELNRLVTNWVYELPSYKFQLFTKKNEDLLQALETESEQ